MHKFQLVLNLSKGITWPNYTVSGTVVNLHELEFSKTVEVHASLDSEFLLDYTEKPQFETVVNDGVIIRDQAIEIVSMHVDDIMIPENMIALLGHYIARYRSDFENYCNSNNIAIDRGPQHISKFWHAGTWSVSWQGDFWNKFQQLRKQNHKDHSDNFIGNSENIPELLKPLKELLNNV